MLTVIIVSWNVRDLLRGCLRSLLADVSAAGVAANVIVVDSASDDGSAEMVREDFPSVQLVACEENIGYVKGNNLAMQQALAAQASAQPSAYLWLLNPDTLVQPGATKTLVEFMQTHPRCGLCGPKLQNPDGSLQHGAFALPGLVQLLIDVVPRLQARFRNTRLDGRYPTQNYDDGQPFRIGAPLGAAMFARTEAAQQIGLLDEGFEMYCEELDWAARMNAANWQVWCVPAAQVTHFGGASSSQASARTECIKWASRRRYFAKHYSPIQRWLALRLAR